MKNIWTNHKISVIILAYALAVAAVGWFAFRPLLASLQNTNNAIEENLLDQQIEQTRLQNLPEMEKDWNEYQTGKSSINVILDPGSEVGFIEGIETIAANTGNTINLQIGNLVTPDQIAKTKQTTTASGGKQKAAAKSILGGITYNNYFPVEIDLSGSYSGLVKFIYTAENMQFYVNIVSISVKKDQVPIDSSGTFSGDMFSSQGGGSNADQKEVLNTVINAIVYTQK